MFHSLAKPVSFLLGGLFLTLIQGCSSVSLQSYSILEDRNSEFSQAVELTEVSFNPQLAYECGPAALATILQSQSVKVTDQDLVPQIYLPDQKGSLQVELLAATRRYEKIPYVIEKNMRSLLTEIKAGNPVLVLQNLGLDWYPKWHYAVVIGYDINKDEIILRSGKDKRHINSFSLFEQTWRRSNHWGFIALSKGKLPATGSAFSYLKAVAAFEELKKPKFAYESYLAGLQRWPNDKNLLMAVGNSSYLAGKLEAAAYYYRKVSVRWPTYAPALNNLAQVLFEKKELKEAEKLVLLAIKQNDKNKKKYQALLKEIRAAGKVN